jgi:hypothetical protein
VTITVGVEVGHQSLKIRGWLVVTTNIIYSYVALSFGYLDAVLLKSYEEFLTVYLSVSVIRVEQSEGSAESSDGGSTSGSELLSHSVQTYIIHHRLENLLETDRPSQERQDYSRQHPAAPSVCQGQQGERLSVVGTGYLQSTMLTFCPCILSLTFLK